MTSTRSTSLLLLVIVLTAVAFSPILRNDFINLDDGYYVTDHQASHALDVPQIFSSYVVGNYHPITMLTYALEYRMFGLNPAGYHAVSLLLHLVNVVLVFVLLRRLSGRPIVAACAAAVFAIHPLHVESVAWASEQKDLLYTGFFLAACVFYLRYRDDGSRVTYVTTLCLFLLALLSKAMAVSLPVVFVVMDLYEGRTFSWPAWKEKIPFVGLSIVFGIVAVYAQASLDSIHDLAEFSLGQRVVFACDSLVRYVGLFVAPVRLSAFYPYPIRSGESLPAPYYVFPLIVAGAIAMLFLRRKTWRTAAFGAAWCVVTLALVLQILPVGDALMADRYSYLPSVGLALLAGHAVHALATRGFARVAGAGLVLVCLVFGYQTRVRCDVWQNSLTFWNDVIATCDTWSVAFNNRGLVYLNDSRFGEAYRDFDRAIALHPSPEAYNNRGIALRTTTRFDEMRRDFSMAIQLRPDYYEAYNNRAGVAQIARDYPSAIRDYTKAIELRPDTPITYCARGMASIQLNDKAPACRDFAKALSLGFARARELVETYCR